MKDDVETSREDDKKRILIDEKECRKCKTRNIPKIIYCGHVVWICQKCLSEKFEENSYQICCPKCQGPLVDPLLNGNGGGNIVQENLFTDLFQDEGWDNPTIVNEHSRRCTHVEGNILSVSFCRLCTTLLCRNCSDSHLTDHLLPYDENIQSYPVERNSYICCIHGTDSIHFCSIHRIPFCHDCKDHLPKECSVKPILEELYDRKQTLLSNYLSLEERESIFRKEQQGAMERLQVYKNRIQYEFEQLVKRIRDRQKELEMSLEEKYKDKEQVLDRKLRRVIEHKSLLKRAMTSPPTPAFFDMTPTLQVLCDNVVSDTFVPDDMALEMNQDNINKVRVEIKSLGKLIESQQIQALPLLKVSKPSRMSDDVETNREDDTKWSLIDAKECHTCMKRNIPKILYCGHVVWICQKCLSENIKAISVQVCCPQCQGPLVDPLLMGNGGGNIVQENLFTDLFQDEEFDHRLIFHETSCWCSKHSEENIPSVSFCRLCKQMLCRGCSDSHSTYHLLQYRESIRSCLGGNSSSICIHGKNSTNFCSTHCIPVCDDCKDHLPEKCSIKPILEEYYMRVQSLLSKYSILEGTESIFIKEQQGAMERLQVYKNRIQDEFEQLVKRIRDRQKELEMSLEEKYKDKEQVLDRKLRRVIEHKSLLKRAMTSPPTPAFFDMTHTLQVLCDNVVSDTFVPDDMALEMNQDNINKVRVEIKSLGKLIESQQKDVLHFGMKCKNIKLSENDKRAERFQNADNGIVLSSQPMEYNKLYQVKVLVYGGGKGGTMMIGVWWKNGEQKLPTTSSRLQSSAIIGNNGIWKDGKKEGTSCAYGKKLNDVREGSKVGIAIRYVDCRLQLHLYINEVDCGPSPVDLPKEHNNTPFAVFDIRRKVKKIQALPLKKVSTYSPKLPCGKPCVTCKQINSACSISGPRGGLNLTSTGVSCDSTNVVYVVTCNKCNMLYVGTGKQIMDRCESHRYDKRSSVYKHVSKCYVEECKYKFSIAAVFKDFSQDEHQRMVMETILMLKLGTLEPSGLNDRVSVENLRMCAHS